VRTRSAIDEREIVERGLVLVRLDPKRGALPGECDELSASDVAVSVGRRPARVIAVERVPRPLRHWLLLDVSESAEGRRAEAKRSAAQYVREVMTPGVDAAAVVTVDEDSILVAGPSRDPAELAPAVEGVPPGGWSALRDGLGTVLRQIQGDRHEQLILFWTDGEDQLSLMKPEELVAALDLAPNATVFPIALRPQGTKFPPPPLTGATFTEIARRSGGEVFVSSDPRWLDRVRGWIGRRFTIAFAPPLGPEDGMAPKHGLEIAVPQKRCRVTLLADPFARPDAIAGAAPSTPSSWLRLHERSPEADDAACASNGGVVPWDRPLRDAPGALIGCVLDIEQAPGPSVHAPDGAPVYTVQPARFAAREVRVLAPELAQLPSDAAEAIDAIVARDGGDPGVPLPLLMEGNAFLAQRARIATSLFATRTAYRDFALERLRRFADEELLAIERDFARAFPGLPKEQIAAVARESRAGRRALEATRTPTDADLVRVLAAWIGDVPLDTLLCDFERRLIDARLRQGEDGPLRARWEAVRRRFQTPSRWRIAAPLALLHDPNQDVVGFVRIVSPRPERFFPPAPQSPAGEARIESRLPIGPLALELVASLAARPGVGEAFGARDYRAVSIVYRPLDPVVRRDPVRPYTHARVAVTLEAAANEREPASRVVVDADVSASPDGSIAISRLAPSVTGDPTLASLLQPAPEE
jgi:hypothetical protein